MGWVEDRREADREIQSSRYRRFRRRMMARDEWLCRLCAKAGRVTEATILDHIVPRYAAPERVFDPGNVQALCGDCHTEKTLAEEARRYPHLRENRVELDRRFLDEARA